MGHRERARWADHDTVDRLLELDRPLTATEIQTIKTTYTGAGGLVRAHWNRGQFFTPPSVVRFVHGLLNLPERQGAVLDLGCGAGAFLEGLDASRSCGIDIDAKAIRILTLCYPEARTIRGDALEEFLPDLPSPLDGSFDQVVGNPPFGACATRYPIPAYKAGHVNRSEEIFWYLAYRACKPGGQIALILPDGVLSNQSSIPLRKWLMDRCTVRAVISLPMETFKPSGTNCKTSVVYLEKFPATQTTPPADYASYMAICEDIGWDSRCRPTGKDDLPRILQGFRSPCPPPLPLEADQPPEPVPVAGPSVQESAPPETTAQPAESILPNEADLAAVDVVATPNGPAIARRTAEQLRLF
jgi:SAM-dependent methyltransferase